MTHLKVIRNCGESLAQLDSLVAATEKEVLGGAQGIKLITDNVNFFTKSFLITLCAQLETCIKDVLYAVACDIDTRLQEAVIPEALLDWRYKAKKNEKQPIRAFSVKMTKKEIDDVVSGNVYKTKDSLLIVGVDLAFDTAQWETWKDLIQSIVTRRNNIVHHDDDASDLSFGDIRLYINSVKEYLNFISEACRRAHNN